MADPVERQRPGGSVVARLKSAGAPVGYENDLVLEEGAGWWDAVEPADSWDAALAAAPPSAPLGAAAAHELLLVLADFADLKSPWTSGHSRAVAALALEACGPAAEAAALVHDLGRVAVPNTIWDKPGPLTRDERDRAETHALVTDQLLRRVPYTATLAGPACAAHERVDGSGYHRRVNSAHLDEAQRVLAAAGHRRAARPPLPAGLTAREAEVLRLLALGLTTRQVADRLVISAKTADHHVQHIYTKIGVSTRGAAALFAIGHGILAAEA